MAQPETTFHLELLRWLVWRWVDQHWKAYFAIEGCPSLTDFLQAPEGRKEPFLLQLRSAPARFDPPQQPLNLSEKTLGRFLRLEQWHAEGWLETRLWHANPHEPTLKELVRLLGYTSWIAFQRAHPPQQYLPVARPNTLPQRVQPPSALVLFEPMAGNAPPNDDSAAHGPNAAAPPTQIPAHLRWLLARLLALERALRDPLLWLPGSVLVAGGCMAFWLLLTASPPQRPPRFTIDQTSRVTLRPLSAWPPDTGQGPTPVRFQYDYRSLGIDTVGLVSFCQPHDTLLLTRPQGEVTLYLSRNVDHSNIIPFAHGKFWEPIVKFTPILNPKMEWFLNWLLIDYIPQKQKYTCFDSPINADMLNQGALHPTTSIIPQMGKGVDYANLYWATTQPLKTELIRLVARLRSGPSTGGLSCFDLGVYIFGSKGEYWNNTSFSEGCQNPTTINQFESIDATINPELLRYGGRTALDDWVTLTIEVTPDSTFRYVNGKRVLSLPNRARSTDFSAFGLSVKGSGQVDWLRVDHPQTGQVYLFEDFGGPYTGP